MIHTRRTWQLTFVHYILLQKQSWLCNSIILLISVYFYQHKPRIWVQYTVHLYTKWGFESLVIVNWNDRASKNCWVTLARRNIDHYPLLIKTIFNAQGVRFSSDNGLAQGGTPSASVPRQQISIRIVQKSLNKKPPSLQCLLYFAGPASVDRTGSRELCGVWTEHLSPLSSLVYLISLEAAFWDIMTIC